MQRHEGEPVETPAPPTPPVVSKGPKLPEAWKTGSGTRGSRKPSPKTLLEAVYAVRRFTEWHGDARLGDITRAMGREFALALAKVPTGLPDSLRQTPLRELVKRDKELAHLTGHAGGGGVGRGYGRGFGLKARATEMAKIEAPEAVRGLTWSEAEAGEVH